MATKIYTVLKDGEEVDKVKTLAAAKKLADENEAEVFTGGKCVYVGKSGLNPDETDAGATENKDEGDDDGSVPTTNVESEGNPDDEEKSIVTAEPVVAKKPAQPEVKEPDAEKYRLKALMNIRKAPNFDAEITTTKPEGTVVRVLSIEDDWMCLADGTYVFYKGGEFAGKI